MDSMTDRLFEISFKADKSSREFDLALLEEIKSLRNIPAKNFDLAIRKIMRKKSTCKLWFTNNVSREWDGKNYRNCNYRCCPSSHNARHYFCLMLDRTDSGLITVKDGFLVAV